MATTETPQHEHDCDVCVFLGRYEDRDLYYHPGDSVYETVVSRYGPDGDYTSGIVFADRRVDLGEALRRAAERGLR